MVTELRCVSYGKTWFYSKCNGKPLVDLKQKKDTVQFLLLKQSFWQLCIGQEGDRLKDYESGKIWWWLAEKTEIDWFKYILEVVFAAGLEVWGEQKERLENES